MKSSKSKILIYIIILISIAIVAGLGSLFVNLGMEWFSLLTKPSQFIPSFIIPIVWTIIYIIFAIVLCLIVSNFHFRTKTIVLLIINGILNLFWCLAFFTFNLTFLGQIAIILLLISSYLLIIDLFKYNQFYVYILVIYPIWVSIATSLNLSLWILN